MTRRITPLIGGLPANSMAAGRNCVSSKNCSSGSADGGCCARSASSRRQEPTAPGILDRIHEVTGSVWATTQLPTTTQRKNLAWAEEGLATFQGRFDTALSALKALEDTLEAAKAPYTPGRALR